VARTGAQSGLAAVQPGAGWADCRLAMAREISIGAARPARRVWTVGRDAPPAPRFVVRVLATSFLTVVAVLAAVSTLLVLQTRAMVDRGIAEDLVAAQRQLAAAERDRQQDAVLRATLIAISRALERGLESYQEERRFGGDAGAARLLQERLQREIDPMARLVRTDVMAVVGLDGRVIATAGPRAWDWPAGLRMVRPAELDEIAGETIVRSQSVANRATVAPMARDGLRLGHLVEARVLDDQYAAELAGATRSDVAVLVDGRLLACTVPLVARDGLAARLSQVTTSSGNVEADGRHYAYRLLQRVGPAQFYAVASITAARERVIGLALPRLLAIGVGGLALCALASLWLARRVAAPIDQVSRDIAAMVEAHEAARIGVPAQSIHELEALGDAFNRLMQTVHDARAETDAAYVGAIQALAAALDARDPYTAGHSDRVSRMAVLMGRAMGLTDAELDVLHLGALLHDIGKIGISDAILGKPGKLTDEEYASIKRHTLLGAQILRPVAFLAPHVPIVELHHERPDGKGYPYGLKGEEIPLLARIVHVADAYDAMTTARAYRPPRPLQDVLTELWRNAGSDFDLAALQALASVLPELRLVTAEAAAGGRAPAPRADEAGGPPAILPFERRVS
jgi:putative nucleotidyltransferase with HDIG domain